MKESKQTLNPLSKETHADTPRSCDSLLSPAHTHTHTVITTGESERATTQHQGLIYMYVKDKSAPFIRFTLAV